MQSYNKFAKKLAKHSSAVPPLPLPLPLPLLLLPHTAAGARHLHLSSPH